VNPMFFGMMLGAGPIVEGRPCDIADPRIPQAPDSALAAVAAAAEKRARKAARRLGGAR